MKKKGFTLIELLAVIIILAVIAIIATPVVLNVVEKATENARKNSVLGYADAVKLSYTEEILENTGKPLKELANNKTQGSKVECEYVKYDDQRYGSLLHTCSVNEKGNYCYFGGIAYEGDSTECDNVLLLIQNDAITYNQPIIEQVSQTPSDTTYAQSKDIKVSYPSIKIVEENYFIKVSEVVELNGIVSSCGINELPGECTTYNGVIEPETWYKVNGELTFTTDKNMTIEAITGNNNEFSSKTIYQENKIDKTEPNASIGSINAKTDRAVVTATCSDSESGITKYEFSKDDGATWVYNGTNAGYAFTGLKQNTEYKFKVRCTNGAALTNEASSTKTTTSIKAPEITQSSQKPTDTNTYPTYASERVIKITYYSDNIENPKYYYSTDGSTWTEVNATTKDLTFQANGKVYAKTTDAAGNTASASTYSVVNIDTTEPNVSIAVGTMQTDRTTVTATCSDDISGIVKYEFSKDNGSTWVANGTTSSYTFTGLTQNTSYTFAVRCTNGAALTKTASSDKSTTGIVAPTIAQVSQTPSSGTYAQSRVIRITYSSANIASPKYYYSLDGSTWTEVTGATTKDLTFQENGKVYAKTTDAAGNTASASTYTVTNIDTTAPSLTLGTVASTSSVITVPFTASDSESGIASTTCVYGTSTSYGSTGTISGTNCVISGLTANTTYYYKITTTNGVGTATDKTGSKATVTPTNPTIEQTSATIASGYTWATQRVIKITYSATNSSSPTYYFKSTVAATVASGVVTQACGTGTNPGTCSASSVTTLAANTWYRTTSTTPSITYTANGTLYAITKDGNNFSGQASYSIAQTSSGTPSTPAITGGSTSWSTTAKTISVSTASTEISGIKNYQYCISTSTSSCNGTWTNTATSTTSQSISTEGTRYIYFRAIANNGKASAASAYQTTKIDSTTPPAPTLTASDGITSGNWHRAYFTLTASGGNNLSGNTYYYKPNQAVTKENGLIGSAYAANADTASYTYYVMMCSGAGLCGPNSSYTIKLDTTVPTVTASVSGKTATFTIKDNISAVGYGVNQSSSTQPTYTAFTGTTSTTKTWTASAAGTYYVWVKDAAGNVNKTSFTIAASAFCSYSAGQAWEYAYTGGVQTFAVPCAGTYKLEVWGAQGGSIPQIAGGKGGYSYGNISLAKSTNLYIVVGSTGTATAGTTGVAVAGGYNGGGKAYISNSNYAAAGGGGATHIATTNRGELKNYSSYKSEVLIVGGGAGGAYYEPAGSGFGNILQPGATGGGTTGGNTVGTNSTLTATGGSQNSAGTGHMTGGFGIGADADWSGGGAGGGWYGGGTNYYADGAGGSGYIGGVSGGSTTNGQQSGNGKARITLVSTQ